MMLTRFVFRCLFLSVVVFFSVFPSAFGQPGYTDFITLDDFPAADMTPYGGVVAAGLPDGRWVVWNGDAIFVQSGQPVRLDRWVGESTFVSMATGYKGDPAFIAVSPDGHTVVLGAGFRSGYTNNLYKVDINDLMDYTPDTILAKIPHYSGVFLNDHIIAIEQAAGTYPDPTTSALVLMDVSSKSPLGKTVMYKPAVSDLTGTQYGVSGMLAVNQSRTTLYAMSITYDGWNLVGAQLKALPVSVLIAAYEGNSLLTWNDCGVAIGAPNAFNSAGPSGVAANGDLFIGGFGGIQRISSVTDTLVTTYSPAGDSNYYAAAYNPFTDVLLAITPNGKNGSMDVVQAPVTAFGPLPAVQGTGLLLIFLLLGVGGIGRLRLTRSDRAVNDTVGKS